MSSASGDGKVTGEDKVQHVCDTGNLPIQDGGRATRQWGLLLHSADSSMGRL